MRSPSNPIADDIRRWAFTPGATEPVQDWDLLLATTDQDDLFMELASDAACPQQDYFLGVLYLIVGDAVRTEYRTHSRGHIESLLQKAAARVPQRRIYLWTQRSKHLMAHPSSFQYNDWCAGGLARSDQEA